MSTETASGAKEGFIPKSNARPRALPLALSLYRTDVLFRGLVDVTLVGIIVLTFAYGGGMFSGISDLLKTAFYSPRASKTQTGIDYSGNQSPDISNTQTSSASVRNQVPPQKQSLVILRSGSASGPGQATEISIEEVVRIQKAVIESAPPNMALSLKVARGYQDLPSPKRTSAVKKEAFDALRPFDQNDPIVAYAKASLLLQLGNAADAIEAQRLLRVATAAAIPEAYTLSGLAAFRLVRMHDRGQIGSSALKTLDGAGNVISSNLQDLSAEAKLWFERGASLRQVDAIRLLAYAEFIGLGGKRNVSAAVAHWRDAANLDDGPSQFALGWLYLRGVGVSPDIGESIRLMQQSVDQGFEMGNLGLGIALLPKILAGDVQAGKRAIAALEESTEKAKYRQTVAMSHSILGRYLMEAAPPSLRDPKKGFDHHRLALNYGYPWAAVDMAEAYKSGTGVERDLVKAHKMLVLVGPSRRKDMEPMLKELREKMTPQQRAAALASYRELLASEQMFKLGRFRPVKPAGSLKRPPKK
ncbi:MAG: sel1 repeat family protein [Hyphomicrobiaceae bacterium]|nr:sel1 repeat family protein [Hyphomicrobiaceae bacterium]